MRLLIIAAGVYVLVRICDKIGVVVIAVILTLFLTAVLHPLEKRLRAALRGPKSLTALLALLAGIAALGVIGWFVSWQITSQSTQLADQLSAVVTHAGAWLQNGPLHVKSVDLHPLANGLTDAIRQHQGQLVSGAIATVRAVAEIIAALLLVLLTTFYLLRDGDLVWRWVLALFPRAARDRVDHAGRAGWRSFGGYMRGQLLIALVHGASIMVLLLALRVPLAVRWAC